ncbi:MAG: lasso peptide biosynthesis B2 protein [Leptolyngbya sp.]|nr:lasso peptide biosynthesis B2 protein [Leptolyngbya sp.]
MSWHDRWLLLQVTVLLGVFRALILTAPFPRLASYFGQYRVESPQEADPFDLHQARQISWAIRAVSPYTPWTSNCFAQALTAKYLLHRRGIVSTLYFGAYFNAPGAMKAHAWLRCGPLMVTGETGHLSFGTTAYFSS